MVQQINTEALSLLRLMQSLYEDDLIETAPEWALSLRKTIAEMEAALRALTQRPAAQTEREGWTDADADAARLALELECLLLDTKDTASLSRWWASANDALDLHRARLAAPQQATPEPAGEHVGTVAEVHMSRYTLEWNGAPLPEGTKLYTRPAPGVPEGVLADMQQFAKAGAGEYLGPNHMALVLKQKINEWVDALAAQAKGGR